jgi:hypothetical protein
VTVAADLGAHAAVARRLSLPVWPLALFTLWDFYVGGIRPFDHLALLFLLTAIWADPARRFNREGAAQTLLVLGTLWLVVLTSFFRNADAWKPALGVLEGGLVAIIVASSYWRREDIHRLLTVLIVVHAGAALLQFAVFYVAHYALNYQAFLGTTLRTGMATGFRAAGLFLEPASYCLMMFSLLSLYRVTGARDARIELLGIATILLSISLWGWVSVLVYMALFRPRWGLFLLPVLVAVAAYVTVTLTTTEMNDNIIMWEIVNRVMHPGADTSSQARYGGLFQIAIWDWKLWFGEGVKTDYDVFGNNGLSFLLTSGGFVGTALITMLWWMILPWGRKFQGLVSLAFMLSAASQWTFCWWWAWLALAGVTGSGPTRILQRE